MKKKLLVYIVDDDHFVRDSLFELLESVGINAAVFRSADEFLSKINPDIAGCLVLDIRMPGMSGLALQVKLRETDVTIPIIFITGYADVPMAVEAVKQGAVEFIQKPFRDQELLDCISHVMQKVEQSYEHNIENRLIRARLKSLTNREKEVLERISEGHANKVIADKMGISQRTVENHRANLLDKMDARSTAGLIKLLVNVNSNG